MGGQYPRLHTVHFQCHVGGAESHLVQHIRVVRPLDLVEWCGDETRRGGETRRGDIGDGDCAAGGEGMFPRTRKVNAARCRAS